MEEGLSSMVAFHANLLWLNSTWPGPGGETYTISDTGDSARIWCGVFGRHIQRMQKALTQMNIQLANVISDITGVTGQAILKAILDGERDPREVAGYRDCRVEASKEEIAQALEGNWQEDQLFVLRPHAALRNEICEPRSRVLRFTPNNPLQRRQLPGVH